MNIVIGADFVSTESNETHFCEGNYKYLLGEDLSKIIEEADYRIFNLEAPFSDSESPILKYGPSLIAKPNTAFLYKSLGVNLLTLANNHIMDQGRKGLETTIATLRNNGIEYVGAGVDLEKASRPYITVVNGVKIGVYACVEHEFSVATEISPGANPFDVYESYAAVENLKRQCAYVIVLYHGGKEYYRYPSPDLQKNCRRFIKFGADVVICQHSHCVGCKEEYQGGTIVYGQGNFLFDKSESPFWKTSILIQIIDGKIAYIPVEKKEEKVQLATGQAAKDILDDFFKRSSEIKEPLFVDSNFKKFSTELLYEYLWQLSGANKSIILRFINRISKYTFYRKYIDRKFSKIELCNFLNCFECEAHREAIITAIKEKLLQS